MLYDYDSPTCPPIGHADVCIVGAGAAGILLATQLSAAGRTVTLLEGGGLNQEARSQEIYRSVVSGQPHQGIHHGRFRTYGGTTTQWGGQILELDDFDFARRAHVAESGWPFPKSELTPYYERSLEFAGLRRVQRDNEQVRQQLGLESFDLGPDFSMLYSRWLPERNFTVLHEHALTHTRRLSVFTHASAVGFELNDGAIGAVQVRGFSGKTARVTADNYVLCLGAIENVRLLLQPVEGAPWQASGYLGRHYQDHIGLNGIPIHKVAAQPSYRHFGYVTTEGFRYHKKIQMNADAQVRESTLNVAGTISPLREENLGRNQAMFTLRQMARERKLPAGAEGLQLAWHFPAIATMLASQRLRGEGPEWTKLMMTIHCEQEPSSPSNITLAAERDELGLLRTNLDWQITSAEIESIRAYVRTAQREFGRAGFAEVAPPAGFFDDDALVRAMCGDSNHHMGGTRMSSDAAKGIVDADLRIHGVANGFVCSSSVFPSSGFSNPTHTILALAMRLADKLGGKRREVEVAAPARQVTPPGAAIPVPQLGFGCAYLLGPGLDAAKSRRLLDAAWDAGVRHYDVARLYGQGHTEALLGEFLKDRPDATVTTKYGVVPPTSAGRVLAALGRHIAPLAPVANALKASDRAEFTGADARRSLDLSLRRLGRDRVDLFLLHEPFVDDLTHPDLLAFLEEARTNGKIGQFGIGGEYYRMAALHAANPAYAAVIQFEWSIFGPALDLPGTERIHYRSFARPAAALSKLFAADTALAGRWSEEVEADLTEPILLSRLLLRAALDAAPHTLTLFSTRSEQHIYDNMQVAGDLSLAAPAQALLRLVQEEPLGLPAQLYPPA